MQKEQVVQQVPDIQSKLAECADQLISYIQEGAVFVKDQAPLVAQEYLRWVFWEHLIWAIVLALGVALFGYFTLWCLQQGRKVEKEQGYYNGDWHIGAGFLCLPTIACLCASIYNFSIVVKVLVAPRVVILETLKKLL